MYGFSAGNQSLAGTEAEVPSLAGTFTVIGWGVINDSNTSNLSIFTLGDGANEEFRITISPGSTTNQIRFRGYESAASRQANVSCGASAFQAGERVLFAATHDGADLTMMVIRESVGSGTVYTATVSVTAFDMPSDLSLWCLGSSSDADNGVTGSIGSCIGSFALAIRDHSIETTDLAAIWDADDFWAPITLSSGNMTGVGGLDFAMGFNHMVASGYIGSAVQATETVFQGTSFEEDSTISVINAPTYTNPFDLGFTETKPGLSLTQAIIDAGYIRGVSGKAASLASGTFNQQLRVVASNRSRATRKVGYTLAAGSRMQNYWDAICSVHASDVKGVDGQTAYINTNNGFRPVFDCSAHAPWRSDPSVNIAVGNFERFGFGNPGNLETGMGNLLYIPAGESYEILAHTDAYGLANDADLIERMVFLVGDETSIAWSSRSYTKQADDGGSTEIATGSTGTIGDGSAAQITGRESSTTTEIVYDGDETANVQAGDFAYILSGTNAGSCNCVLTAEYDGGADETTVTFQSTWHDGTSTFSPANDDEIEYTTWTYHSLQVTIPDQTGTNPTHDFRGLRVTAGSSGVWLCFFGAWQGGNGIIVSPYGAGAATDEQLDDSPYSQDGVTNGHEHLIEIVNPDVWLQFLNGGPTAGDYDDYVTTLSNALQATSLGTMILVGDGPFGSTTSLNPNDDDALLEELWTLVPGKAHGGVITVERDEVGSFPSRLAKYDMADGAHPSKGTVSTIQAAFALLGSLPVTSNQPETLTKGFSLTKSPKLSIKGPSILARN